MDDETAYPPAPWRLRGTLYGSVWSVPEAEAPELPHGLEPLAFGSRRLLLTGWAIYDGSGMLSYREALLGILIRRPCFPAIAITRIWVDHPASVEGGRALWSIPKEMGAFGGTPEAGAAVADAAGRPVASLHFTPRATMAWRHAARFRTVQPPLDTAGAGQVVARMRASGRPALGRAEWSFAPEGPLAFLHGRKPLFSVQLTDARLDFGL